MAPSNVDSIRALIAQAVLFRDERDWAQFHTVKELAISLVVEAGELLQELQWYKEEDQARVAAEKGEALKAELGDVFFSVLLLAHELQVDLGEVFLGKLKKTGEKYPVDKSKGSPRKYTEL